MDKLKAAMTRWRQKVNGRFRIVEVLTKNSWDSVEEMNRDTKYLTKINLTVIGANAIIFLLHLALHLTGQR